MAVNLVANLCVKCKGKGFIIVDFDDIEMCDARECEGIEGEDV
jgi:hypothetical protein